MNLAALTLGHLIAANTGDDGVIYPGGSAWAPMHSNPDGNLANICYNPRSILVEQIAAGRR
jgi:hypothetical protein